MTKFKKKDVEKIDTITKSKVPQSQKHLPKELRGLATNKYGGTHLTKYKGFLGQSYGAASKGRSYSPEEIAAYAKENGYGVCSC